MSAYLDLSPEDRRLYSEYQRKLRQGLRDEITPEERAANTVYKLKLNLISGKDYLYRSAKNRAKVRGIEWTITKEDYFKLAEKTTHCPILGLELTYNCCERGKKNHAIASIDRIDSSKPYTIDNIQIISWRANEMKNKHSEDQLARDILAAVEWAKQKLGEQNDCAKV